MRRLDIVLLAVGLLFAASCSDAPAPADAAPDGQRDTVPWPDVLRGDKAQGDRCSEGAECASGFCLPAGDGEAVCAAPCGGVEGTSCLAGWTCEPETIDEFTYKLCRCQATAEVCDGSDGDCDGRIDVARDDTPACAPDGGVDAAQDLPGGAPDAGGDAPPAVRGGGSGSDRSHSVAIDPQSGKIWITGDFRETASFGGTALTTHGSGDTDIFVAQYSPQGALLWAIGLGGVVADSGHAVAVDGSGNGYVGGYFSGTVSFGSTPLTSQGAKDSFLAKISPAGTVLWATAGAGAGDAHAQAAAVDGAGNPLVAGSFSGTASFGGAPLTAAGAAEVFVAKYDAAGTPLWSFGAGGSGTDEALGLSTDSSGDALVTGFFSSTASFGGTDLTSHGAGDQDLFVAKLSGADGSVTWVESAGGPNNDLGHGIRADSADNVLLTGSLRSTGSFAGTPLPTSGEEDILVAKLSGAGTLAWAIMVGGAGADVGYGLAVDSSDHAWVVGRFHAPLTVAGIPLAGAGFDDVIVFEVSPAGTPLWGMAAGGSSFDYALEVASSAAGAPWVTGYFQGVADFGGTQLSASGGTDIFLWQVEP